MKTLTLILSSLLISSTTFANQGTYEFPSPFINGESDVAYDGQTTRQILINSLKNVMDAPKSIEKNEAGKRTDIPKGGFEIGQIGQSREESALNVLKTYIDYRPEPMDLETGEILEDEVYGGFYGYSPLYFQTMKTVMGPLRVESSFEYDSSADAPDNKKLILDYIFLSSSADLRKKIAGIDNDLFHGELLGFSKDLNPNGFYTYKHSQEEGAFFKDVSYENTPESYVNYLIALWAEDAGRGLPFTANTGGVKPERVEKVGVLSNGWNLTQLTQKFLHGAISFSQSARDYLSTDLGDSKGLNADNEVPAKAGRAYTVLAHHWDEAFGYFGASRDYLSFEADEVKSGLAADIDLNNEINLRSEVNYGLAINAVKRDLGASGTEAFAENIYSNFLKGRTLINQKPEGYREEIKVIAKDIINEWERLFAANTIHYINKTSKEYDKVKSETGYSFLNLAKYWSEMKGFAMAFQFNPNSVMSAKDFDALHSLLRAEPELREMGLNSYKLDLAKARHLLVETYGFDKVAAEKM